MREQNLLSLVLNLRNCQKYGKQLLQKLSENPYGYEGYNAY